jgi:hypothetical protein
MLVLSHMFLTRDLTQFIQKELTFITVSGHAAIFVTIFKEMTSNDRNVIFKRRFACERRSVVVE